MLPVIRPQGRESSCALLLASKKKTCTGSCIWRGPLHDTSNVGGSVNGENNENWKHLMFR